MYDVYLQRISKIKNHANTKTCKYKLCICKLPMHTDCQISPSQHNLHIREELIN